MKLKNGEYVDLSKYTTYKRKNLFPYKHFSTATYCIVFKNVFGCFTSHFDSTIVYKHALEDLISNGFKEIHIGCNNLGRM